VGNEYAGAEARLARRFKVKRAASVVLTIVFCTALISGCASQRKTEQLGGAVIGSLLALAGGLVAGTNAQTTAGLAVGGALLGWGTMVAVRYHGDHLASAANVLPPNPWEGGPIAKIDAAEVSPSSVKAGTAVEILTTYSLNPGQGEITANVEESWILRRGAVEIATLTQAGQQRLGGRWQSGPRITIPADAVAGSYDIEHVISVNGTFDSSAHSGFEVTKAGERQVEQVRVARVMREESELNSNRS